MTEEPTRKRTDDPIGRVVAGNLRRLRQYKGWTQAQVAERLAPYIGVELSSAAISQWEDARNPQKAGRSFSMTEAWAICRVFQIPLPRLLMPGIWEPAEAEVPDLFGEHYADVWNDCFTNVVQADVDHWRQIGRMVDDELGAAREDLLNQVALQEITDDEPDDSIAKALKLIGEAQEESDRKVAEALAIIRAEQKGSS